MRHMYSGGAVVLAMLLTACSGTAAVEKGEPEIGAPDVITKVSQVKPPLAAYLSTAADEQAFFAAVNVEQRACARAYGVNTTIPLPVQASGYEMALVRRYGVVDSSEVDRYGYGFVPSTAAEVEKQDGWNPGVHEVEVMNGVDSSGEPVAEDSVSGKSIPQGGCSVEGQRRVVKDDVPVPDNSLAEELLTQAWDLTRADSRAIAAQKAWATCMDKRGYAFKHRWEAGNSVGGSGPEAQLKMATTDLSCAQKVNYIGVWYSVDTGYQDRLMRANESDLEAIAEQKRAVMRRVSAILQGR